MLRTPAVNFSFCLFHTRFEALSFSWLGCVAESTQFTGWWCSVMCLCRWF